MAVLAISIEVPARHGDSPDGGKFRFFQPIARTLAGVVRFNSTDLTTRPRAGIAGPGRNALAARGRAF